MCKNLFRLTWVAKCRFFGQGFTVGYISCCCWFLLADITHIIMYKLNSGKLRVSGPFLESPENVSGLKTGFMLAVLAFKIKVSITLKMIQWQYQLTTQNWPVCELGLNCVAVNSTGFDFKIFLIGPKKLPGLSWNGPLECSTGRYMLQEGFHF